MWLLILEALGALALFIAIVAWTMAGRRRGDDGAATPGDAGDGAAGRDRR